MPCPGEVLQMPALPPDVPPGNNIQLKSISLLELHYCQGGILSSWSMVGNVQRATDEGRNLSVWLPERKAQSRRGGCYMSKGPAKMTRIVPSKKETRGGDINPKKGDRRSTGLCLYFRQTYLFRGNDKSVLGIDSSFLRVQSTFLRWWIKWGEWWPSQLNQSMGSPRRV